MQSCVYSKSKGDLRKMHLFTLVVLLLNLLIVFISLYLHTVKGCLVKTVGALQKKLIMTIPVVSSAISKKGIQITFNIF